MPTPFSRSLHSEFLFFQEAGTAIPPLGSNVGYPYNGEAIPSRLTSSSKALLPTVMRRTSLGGGSLCQSAAGVLCFQEPQSCSHEGRNYADKKARVLGDPSKHRFLTMELRGRREVCGPKNAATGFNDDVVGVGG